MPRIHTLSDIVYVKATEHNFTASGSGSGIDCIGYSSAMFSSISTTASDGTGSWDLYDSPDNSAWTLVSSAFVTAAASKTAEVKTASIDLKKRQRYLRVVYTVAGASNHFTNFWALTNPSQWPVSQTNTTVYI